MFYRHVQALSFKTFTQHCFNDFNINKGKREIELEESQLEDTSSLYFSLCLFVSGGFHF